ncbi:MAG: hypothetical protein LBC92_02735 [Rickettsiales bacterium]|jgi:DNA-binding ferritin-like protein|nr:hypothetical protein [Rickettsiales bacterium]
MGEVTYEEKEKAKLENRIATFQEQYKDLFGATTEEADKMTRELFADELEQLERIANKIRGQAKRSGKLSESNINRAAKDVQIDKEKEKGIVGRSVDKVRELLNFSLDTINERIKRISEDLYYKIVKNENTKYLEVQQYNERVKSFVDKMAVIRKTNKELYKQFVVMWNWKDVNNLARFLEANHLVDDFAHVKLILNELYNRQLDTGIALPYASNYLPSQVDDVDGLMEALERDLGTNISGDIDSQAYHRGLVKGTPDRCIFI